MSDFVHDACCLARKDHGADPGWASGPARPRWWPARAAWTLWALTLLGPAATAWLDRLLRCPGRQLPGRARQRRQHRLPVLRRRRCPGPGGIVGADHPDHTPVRPDLRSPGGGLLTVWLSGDRTAARKVSTRQVVIEQLFAESPPAHRPAVQPCRLADLGLCSYPLAEHAGLSVFVVGGASVGYGVRGVSSGTEDPSSAPSGPTGVKVESPWTAAAPPARSCVGRGLVRPWARIVVDAGPTSDVTPHHAADLTGPATAPSVDTVGRQYLGSSARAPFIRPG